MLFRPFFNKFRNFQIILLQHHHMAVSVDSYIFQTNKIMRDAALVQHIGDQVIASGMLRSLTYDEEYRNSSGFSTGGS